MNMMPDYPIASMSAEDIQKIVQVENGIRTISGKKIILIAYEGQ